VVDRVQVQLFRVGRVGGTYNNHSATGQQGSIARASPGGRAGPTLPDSTRFRLGSWTYRKGSKRIAGFPDRSVKSIASVQIRLPRFCVPNWPRSYQPGSLAAATELRPSPADVNLRMRRDPSESTPYRSQLPTTRRFHRDVAGRPSSITATARTRPARLRPSRLRWRLGKVRVGTIWTRSTHGCRLSDLVVTFFSAPWPWYIAGPVIGLFVPALLIVGNRMFGASSNLRHICSALLPVRVEYLRYDWKRTGLWNLIFLAGTTVGGLLASQLGGFHSIEISERTRLALTGLGIHDFSGLAPREVFMWSALLTPGIGSVVLGGFLVGFGTAYAGGCTSGHAISGLADLQLPSLIAVVGFFAGGLLATHFVLPLIF